MEKNFPKNADKIACLSAWEKQREKSCPYFYANFCVINVRIIFAIVYKKAGYMIDRMHSIRVVDHFRLYLLYPGFKSCFERIFPIQFSASSCGQTRVLIYWWDKSAVR